MASAFDTFIGQAWADHADQPEAVARRLRSETPEPASADQLAALARLVVHLCGEHLGTFDDGRQRLAALAGHRLADAGVQSALRVGVASLDLAEHGRAQRKGFTLEERLRSEAAAAAISLGRRQTGRAMQLLGAARKRLATMPAAPGAVHRPLAVVCNNMAWALQERGSDRGADDTAAMLDLAAASRLHWSLAGTWLEVSRADYCLALCHLSAGLPDQAFGFASRCLAGCTDNKAPPSERFFAHEAAARAQHARGERGALLRHLAAAEAEFERLSVDEQDGSRSTLDALKALAR